MAILDEISTILMITVMVFSWVLPGRSLPCFASRERRYVSGGKNQALLGHVIVSQSGTSGVRCAVLCSIHSQCLSFNHREQGGTCQLNGATMESSPGSLQPAAGFSYFGTHGVSDDFFIKIVTITSHIETLSIFCDMGGSRLLRGQSCKLQRCGTSISSFMLSKV